MKRHAFALVGLVGTLAFGRGAAQAQQAPPAGTSPEMQRLAFLFGKWVSDTDEQETTWIAGGKFLQMSDRFKGKAEADKFVLMIGYDPDVKAYRLWSFSPAGVASSRAWETLGRLEDRRLVFDNELMRQALKEHPPSLVPFNGYTIANEPTKEGYFPITTVIANSAEAKAGLRVGDLITKIDGHSVVGLTSPEEVNLEMGKVGTTARITIRRGEQEREIAVVRRPYLAPVRGGFELRSDNSLVDAGEVWNGDHWEKQPGTVYRKVQ